MKNLKFKYKIAFSSIILIIGFGLIYTIIHFSIDYKHKVENQKINSISILENIEPLIAEHMFINDLVGLQRIINRIKTSNPDISYAFIISRDKQILVHTFHDKFPVNLLKINNKPVQNIELLDTGDETLYDFSYPIVYGKLGIIRIGLSRERLLNELHSDIKSLLLLLILFLTISIIVSLSISRHILTPLTKLIENTRFVSEGNFSHVIDINSDDEIGMLSESFNNMCSNLQNLTDKLEEQITLLNQKNYEYAALNEEYETQNEALFIAKQKAEESDKLKTAFLANLSHEIRTPMNGILGFAELLKTGKLPKELQQRYITVIQQSGERMLRLITDLVDISKIEAGQIEVNEEKVNLNQILDKIYLFFEPLSKRKNLLLNVSKTLPDNDCIILTDRIKLEQILTNLINNAFKFTCEGGISFGYEIKNEIIEFWVQDTGRGIPEEMQQLIFERFTQVDDTYLNNIEGSGLGLSICKAYIELMGGKIWVNSELRKGSVFFFNLPNKKTNNEINVDYFVKNKIDFTNLKALIVEDDEVSYMYINEILTNAKMNVFRAQNGKEALHYLSIEPDINIILMDLKLPVLNGIDTTIEIRKFNKNVPIIAQTAYAFDHDKERALAAGCNDFITKPIDKDLLIEKMSNFLLPDRTKNTVTY